MPGRVRQPAGRPDERRDAMSLFMAGFFGGMALMAPTITGQCIMGACMVLELAVVWSDAKEPDHG